MAELFGVRGKLNSCNVYSPLEANGTVALGGNALSDRENVLNFHIGIPHKNDAGRDDVQLLYDNFFYKTTSFDNISTFGGLPFFQKFFSPAGNPNGTGAYNSFLENGFGIGLPPAQMPAYAGMCAYYNLFNVFGASPPCASSGQTPQPFFDGQQVVNANSANRPWALQTSYLPTTSRALQQTGRSNPALRRIKTRPQIITARSLKYNIRKISARARFYGCSDIRFTRIG